MFVLAWFGFEALQSFFKWELFCSQIISAVPNRILERWESERSTPCHKASHFEMRNKSLLVSVSSKTWIIRSHESPAHLTELLYVACTSSVSYSKLSPVSISEGECSYSYVQLLLNYSPVKLYQFSALTFHPSKHHWSTTTVRKPFGNQYS